MPWPLSAQAAHSLEPGRGAASGAGLANRLAIAGRELSSLGARCADVRPAPYVLIRFQAIQARDVRTPRTVVAVASEDASIADYYVTARDHSFSRIPVYDESKDHVTGYLL